MMRTIRSLIRRTAALLAAGAVAFYSSTCLYVSAEEKKSTGYWKLVDQRDESFIAPQDVQYKDVSGSAAGGFHVRREVIEHNHRAAYLHYPGQKGHESCFGEFGEETITFSPLPESKLIPGETLSVNASVSCQTSGHALEPGGLLSG